MLRVWTTATMSSGAPGRDASKRSGVEPERVSKPGDEIVTLMSVEEKGGSSRPSATGSVVVSASPLTSRMALEVGTAKSDVTRRSTRVVGPEFSMRSCEGLENDSSTAICTEDDVGNARMLRMKNESSRSRALIGVMSGVFCG